VAPDLRFLDGELVHQAAVVRRRAERLLESKDAAGIGSRSRRRGSGRLRGERAREDDQQKRRDDRVPPMDDRMLYEGRFLSLKETRGWEYVERRGRAGGVLIVAVTDGGNLLLVEEERPPIRGRVISLPAGLVGDEGEETAEEAGRRELLEETGYTARAMELLGGGPSSPGLANESVVFYRARSVSRTGPPTGPEAITLHEVPLADVRVWAAERERRGAAIHPLLWAGLYLARL
jgi:ADP-ribose pyrophosphatase